MKRVVANAGNVSGAGAAGSAPAGKVHVDVGGRSMVNIVVSEAGAAGSAPAGKVSVAIGGKEYFPFFLA